MGEVISVFEYDLLGSKGSAPAGAKHLNPEVFAYLEELSLTSIQGNQFLKLISRSGFKLLQVQNYAGMLSTPHGFQLEILPKVGKNLTTESARETFITMLSHLPVSTYSNPAGHSAGTAHAFARDFYQPVFAKRQPIA